MNVIGRILLVSIGTLAALAVSAEEPVLGPGGTRISGKVNEYGQFQARLEVKQGGQGLFTILAVQVYAEPSHTLLAALVDEAAPVSVLTAIMEDKPRGLMTGVVGEGEHHWSVPSPPPEDRGIRLFYVIQEDGLISTVLMASVSLKSADEFDFSVEPDGGGGIRRCGYCPPYFCGCINCSGPEWTLCCPSCTMECAFILCP